MGHPVFTYLFYDLMTNSPLAEVTLQDVEFNGILNGYGGFQSSVNMASGRVKEQLANLGGDIGSPIRAAKTALYIDMDGELIWGGILWTQPDYDSKTKILSLGASEFWSYFANGRRITWSSDHTADGLGPQDQLLVFKDLIDIAQGQTGGDLGVITSGVSPSGEYISIKWDATQLTPIGQAVSTLTQQSGTLGFDFSIDVAYDADRIPRKYLVLDYPRRGRRPGTDNLKFDTSNKWGQGYHWPSDGTAMNNTLFGIGAGTGPTTAAGQGALRSTQSYPGALADGYPLLEGTLQRSDITDQRLLDNVTQTALASTAYPVVLPTATFDLDMPDPQFGSYIIGDEAELVIPPDDYFPNGYDEFKRIVGWTVSVPTEGVSTVTLRFVDPPLEL